jgi:hypothetical protein
MIVLNHFIQALPRRSFRLFRCGPGCPHGKRVIALHCAEGLSDDETGILARCFVVPNHGIHLILLPSSQENGQKNGDLII